MLPPASDGDTVTYYPMLFKDYRITYYDENDISLGQDEVSFRADSASEKQNYTVNMGYTVQHETQHFEGWNVKEGGSNITGYTTGKVYQNTDIIEISGDVKFSVNAPEGHWFIFDENGKGATYNAPQFVYSDETPTRPKDNTMIRNGYSFGGWFGTKEEADRTSGGTEYDFDQLLTDKKTVYARWIPNTTAPYTVLFWTQTAEVDPATGKAKDEYELAASYTGNGTVGQNIAYTSVNNQDEDYARLPGEGNEKYHYTGFCLTDASKGQQIEITNEGDAVLNLYYDRIEYNLRFYLYRERNNGGDNRFAYAQNSGGGGNVWGVATWYDWTTRNNMPTTSAKYPIRSTQNVDGYTGYYFELNAYYGKDISGDWPTYDDIHGPQNNRSPVS